MSGSTPKVIYGEVRSQGRGVGDARVFIVDGPGSFSDVAVLSDSDGRFSLTAPAEGDYTVMCVAEGFAPARITVQVPAGIPLRIDLSGRT